MMKFIVGLTAAVFVLFAGTAAAAVQGTKHDLTALTGSVDGLNFQTSTDQICAFCHTPHGSVANAPVPLWNKAFQGSAAYTAYVDVGTGTLDGTAAVVGVSLACLSCHDGSQAMDSMYNAPGSGGFSAVGASAGYTWDAGGVDTIVGAALLGTDLSNDHPVGISYAGGGVLIDGADVPVDGGFVAVDGPGNDTVGGVLPLFGLTATEGTVECASCHNVHDNTNTLFLRVSPASSAICTTCHVK